MSAFTLIVCSEPLECCSFPMTDKNVVFGDFLRNCYHINVSGHSRGFLIIPSHSVLTNAELQCVSLLLQAHMIRHDELDLTLSDVW